MFAQPRYAPEALVPLLAGLFWLGAAFDAGLPGGVLPALPGLLLTGGGVVGFLLRGDPRLPQPAALGGLLGVLFGLPALFLAGPLEGLVLLLLSAASFVAAGAMSVRQEPHPEEVPTPEPGLRRAAEVAADDAILAFMLLTFPNLSASDHARAAGELEDAVALFEERGWLEKPARYHETPPPLEAPTLVRRRTRGLDYEHLSFESGYEPHPDEPGRERWLGHGANRTAHAWVMRHADPTRPWLVAIHGYQMGAPGIDLPALQAARFHHRGGLNLLLPVLPLHGPRKIGRVSGNGFISSDFLDTIHAEAQAMWDIRRMLAWIRAQGGERVGVVGLSLGGYQTALLAALDDGLACAVPGIPATDFARLVARHAPPLEVKEAQALGLRLEAAERALRVVSPLALPPRVPQERRAIFAGSSDLLVPADQVRDLWRHWDRPRIAWYPGGHMTFALHRPVRELVEDTLRGAGLVVGSRPVLG
ncbi:MAG: alpha/beta hydrolase [Myxococcota bacterium]|nr:alpha/beta hydrolase [Myxococcota bacterium]